MKKPRRRVFIRPGFASRSGGSYITIFLWFSAPFQSSQKVAIGHGRSREVTGHHDDVNVPTVPSQFVTALRAESSNWRQFTEAPRRTVWPSRQKAWGGFAVRSDLANSDAHTWAVSPAQQRDKQRSLLSLSADEQIEQMPEGHLTRSIAQATRPQDGTGREPEGS